MDGLLRRLASIALRAFPTCDLQFALSGRPGVRALTLGLGECATVQVGNGDPVRVEGPCTLTVNHD